jgi:hypothetical protein
MMISQSIIEEDNDDNEDSDDDDDTRVSLSGVPISSFTSVDISLSFRSTIEDDDERRLRRRR